MAQAAEIQHETGLGGFAAYEYGVQVWLWGWHWSLVTRGVYLLVTSSEI